MSALFEVLLWTCLVLYALMVAAQLYGQVFRKPGWVAIAPGA